MFKSMTTFGKTPNLPSVGRGRRSEQHRYSITSSAAAGTKSGVVPSSWPVIAR
jgi:hypothetical protein